MAIALFTGPQDPSQLLATINVLVGKLNANAGMANHARLTTPPAAATTNIKAAATPANGAITIAAQPAYPCKFTITVTIGTGGTTNITAGTLTLVGIDVHGNTVTEVCSLLAANTGTITTANAFAKLTSGTVANYAASGGGTGNTLAIGSSVNVGLPCAPGSPLVGGTSAVTGNTGYTGGVNGFNLFKEMVDAGDEAVGTVDTAAGTVSPTTAPNATHNYDYYWSFNTLE